MTEQPAANRLYFIREIHNFGGFFGGDTVTLSAAPHAAPTSEETLTIDEQALANVADRHTLAAGMLLALDLTGARVDRATLVGAPTHAALRAALGPATWHAQIAAPLVLSYRCAACGLWLAGAPHAGACAVCGHAM